MRTEAIQPIDPAATALLVLDYQIGGLERVESAAELLARANATIDWLRARGGRVAFVRIAFAGGEAPTGTMGRRIGREAVRATFQADAPGTQLHDDLHRRDDDIVVRKTRVGPFGSTDLDTQLRDLCADPEPDVHAFLVERIFPRQADVLDSTELATLAP